MSDDPRELPWIPSEKSFRRLAALALRDGKSRPDAEDFAADRIAEFYINYTHKGHSLSVAKAFWIARKRLLEPRAAIDTEMDPDLLPAHENRSDGADDREAAAVDEMLINESSVLCRSEQQRAAFLSFVMSGREGSGHNCKRTKAVDDLALAGAFWRAVSEDSIELSSYVLSWPFALHLPLRPSVMKRFDAIANDPLAFGFKTDRLQVGVENHWVAAERRLIDILYDNRHASSHDSIHLRSVMWSLFLSARLLGPRAKLLWKQTEKRVAGQGSPDFRRDFLTVGLYAGDEARVPILQGADSIYEEGANMAVYVTSHRIGRALRTKTTSPSPYAVLARETWTGSPANAWRNVCANRALASEVGEALVDYTAYALWTPKYASHPGLTLLALRWVQAITQLARQESISFGGLERIRVALESRAPALASAETTQVLRVCQEELARAS